MSTTILLVYGGILFVGWVAFNWVAPLAALSAVNAAPLSPGRLPRELLLSDAARRVKFYLADLNRGYGYSVWAPPFNIVLFDRSFFNSASSDLLRFLVAHELAHFSLHHHRKRWLLMVMGIGFLPAMKKLFEKFEEDADAEASRRTGLTRSMFLVPPPPPTVAEAGAPLK